MDKPKLLDQVSQAIRVRHYSIRTEQAYLGWIRQFIVFHGRRHPSELGEKHVSEFLTHLAVKRNVAPSTQNQCLSALLFLYREVLRQPLEWLDGVTRAKKPSRLPTVLTKEEAKAVLSRLDGIHWLMTSLLYGGGLRLMECLRLRVQDIDFTYQQITIRSGKGNKDRVTMLPQSLITPLNNHLAWVKTIHERDLAEGCGCVYC